MGTPRVSIGMPVWNGEAHIREGLDSLLGQTFGDLELIISDNASTDATQDICREYAARDRRIRLHRNSENIGLQGNFQRVLDLATARYFMWGCHDDLWDPSYVERMVEILDDRPSSVLAGSNAGAVDDRGAVIDRFDVADVVRAEGICARALRFIRARPGGGQATLFYGLMRTEMIQRLGYAPLGRMELTNRGYYAADLLTLFRLLFEGEFYVVEETLYFHRDTQLGERGLKRVSSVGRAIVRFHGYYRDLRSIIRGNLDGRAAEALVRATLREEMEFYPAYMWRLVGHRLPTLAVGART